MRTWTPHVTVATVVVNQKPEGDEFLLVHEHSPSGQVYNQPAGHLEQGESLYEAALRETLEETAWEVELTGFLGVSRYEAPNGTTYIRHSFVATPIRHQPNRVLDEGIIEALWQPFNTIANGDLNLRSPLVLRDIEKFREGLIYPLSLVADS